jgi:hypothetical protein
MNKLTACVFPLVRIVAVTAISLAMSGCKSDAQWAKTTSAYKAFVNQQRTFKSFEAAGQNMTFTISGATNISMSAPLNPMSAIPEDPGTVREIVDGAVRIGAIGAAAYGLHEAFDSTGDTTINNAAATP